MARQTEWTATLRDGTETRVFTDPDATEDEARAKLARMMKHGHQNMLLDTSPSRHPVILDELATAGAKRDFGDDIVSIKRANPA
jgi:hypothetical protein